MVAIFKNVLGQTVFCIQENVLIGENNFQIDIGKLSAGVYFVQVEDDGVCSGIKRLVVE